MGNTTASVLSRRTRLQNFKRSYGPACGTDTERHRTPLFHQAPHPTRKHSSGPKKKGKPRFSSVPRPRNRSVIAGMGLAFFCVRALSDHPTAPTRHHKNSTLLLKRTATPRHNCVPLRHDCHGVRQCGGQWVGVVSGGGAPRAARRAWACLGCGRVAGSRSAGTPGAARSAQPPCRNATSWSA